MSILCLFVGWNDVRAPTLAYIFVPILISDSLALAVASANALTLTSGVVGVCGVGV